MNNSLNNTELHLPHDHGDSKNIYELRKYLNHTDDFQVIAEVFKQLGDATRIRIFWLLCHSEECVLNIAAILDMSSPLVSHHLRSLKSNELITSRREGKEVYYTASGTAQCRLLHEMIEQVMKISCPSGLHDVHHTGRNHREDHHSSCTDCSPADNKQTSHIDDYHSSHCSCCQNEHKEDHHDSYQEDQINIIHRIHDRLISDIENRWTVESLAREFLMNPTTLKSMFKAVYGNSIAAHIKEHRMEKAAQLLAETELNLADIASAIGYSSQSKFTAAFKEYFLILPKEYRKNNQRRKNMNALVILAGGLSSRMGQDKTFMTYKGLSFIHYMTEKAWTQFGRVIIAAGSREHAEKIYNHFKALNVCCTHNMPEIIIDNYQQIGPMGGLMSVFEQTKLDYITVTAVDLPRADMKILSTLKDKLITAEMQIKESDNEKQTVSAVMLASAAGKIEPCAAAYSRTAYDQFQTAVKDGSYGIIKTLGDAGIKVIPTEEIVSEIYGPEGVEIYRKSFANINTPTDYTNLVTNNLQ